MFAGMSASVVTLGLLLHGLCLGGTDDVVIAHFGDSHPNPNAVKILADEEFKLLTTTWPQKLPKAKGK